MSEWVKDNGIYYYYYSDGTMATGWQELEGDWYYFYSDGSMAWDTMVDGCYVNDDGQWTKDEGSRKITDNDGNDFWYYVGPEGKAVTGWNKIGDSFHYYNYPGGSMTYENTIDGFQIDEDGNIVSGTGWIQDEYSGNWYYFSDGEMKTGWIQDGDSWYYLKADGTMATGWVEDDTGWYFLDSNGEMKSNDTEDGYHLDSSGKMITGTGWKNVDSWWYYLDDTGKVVTGWLYDQGNWYFLYPQGSMAKDTTIDGYKLNASGEWVPNESNNSQVTSDPDSNDDGVKYVTVDGVEYPDYNEAINDMLQRNEQECLKHRKDLDMGLPWFRDQVDYNAPWDIKMEKRWKEQMPSVPYLGADENGNYGKFVFNGRITTAEELGNFTYGYWGTATGYGQELLNLGAGAAQIKHDYKVSFPTATIQAMKDGAPHYGDNPEDTTQIDEGIDYYYKTHPVEETGDIFDGPVS